MTATEELFALTTEREKLFPSRAKAEAHAVMMAERTGAKVWVLQAVTTMTLDRTPQIVRESLDGKDPDGHAPLNFFGM